MTFVEQLFHVAPDYGSGAFEAVILISILAALSLAALRVSHRSRKDQNSLPPAKD